MRNINRISLDFSKLSESLTRTQRVRYSDTIMPILRLYTEEIASAADGERIEMDYENYIIKGFLEGNTLYITKYINKESDYVDYDDF